MKKEAKRIIGNGFILLIIEMGVSYKNFWSLNVDEAVVTGILRGFTKKYIEAFMPLNSQMKDIDLILMNINNKKVASIQIKGSRAFEPKISEIKKYENGSAGRFYLAKDTIHSATADYFVFLVYVINEQSKAGRRTIEPHTITIPTEKLKKLCLRHKGLHADRYSFLFRINPNKEIAFDIRKGKTDESYDISEFLDKDGIERINTYLK